MEHPDASEVRHTKDLIDRLVVTAGGRTIGRVAAVIHTRTSIDLLIEHRHWLRYQSYRLSAEELEDVPGGPLIYTPKEPERGRVSAA